MAADPRIRASDEDRDRVVSLLREHHAAGRLTAEEFNENTARFAANGGRPAPRKLTDDELARIRKRRAELFAQWAALPMGESLELTF